MRVYYKIHLDVSINTRTDVIINKKTKGGFYCEKTIRDLWCGGVCPRDRKQMLDGEGKALRRKYYELLEKIGQAVSKEVFADVEELVSHMEQISAYFETYAFTEGFSLGARIVSEALSDDED